MTEPLARRARRTAPGADDDRPRLHEALERAMTRDDSASWATLASRDAADPSDALVTMLDIHDLWMAPLTVTGGRERHQSDPVLMAVKHTLEHDFLADLTARTPPDTSSNAGFDAATEMRRIAARERVPDIYHWLAEEATWEQTVRFLAYEGGPDAGFDDLVAVAQVGIRGGPKLTLAANYWDEMGRGRSAEVHTTLHDRLVAATDMPRIPRTEMPTCSLERLALGGVLATNRWLQPELIGALGLLEVQAGPRCRAVLKAFDRLDAPADARPFYEEHAEADPRHGKEWLASVVAPLAEELPDWGPRMVRGALWRHLANHRFFSEIGRFVGQR